MVKVESVSNFLVLWIICPLFDHFEVSSSREGMNSWVAWLEIYFFWDKQAIGNSCVGQCLLSHPTCDVLLDFQKIPISKV